MLAYPCQLYQTKLQTIFLLYTESVINSVLRSKSVNGESANIYQKDGKGLSVILVYAKLVYCNKADKYLDEYPFISIALSSSVLGLNLFH